MSEEKIEPTSRSECDVIRGEIKDAQRRMKKWKERGEMVESLYRGDGDGMNEDSKRFKILWSITEMQRPLIYDVAPAPVVGRRFDEPDEGARLASEIIERSVSYFMECEGHEYHDAMCNARDDFLLSGRGTVRVVYEAEFEEEYNKVYLSQEELAEIGEDVEVESDENGTYRMSTSGEEETKEDKSYEEVHLEYVNWRDFLHSDGRQWDKVWWVAFGDWLTREDLVEQFGEEVGMQVPLLRGWEDEARTMYENELDAYEECARVWTFWSDRTKMVYKVAENYDGFLEDPDEDPYGLKGFFPCPRPAYMVETTGSLEPVPEYKEYEDLAGELYSITGRLSRLTESLAVRGVYDAQFAQSIGKLLRSFETDLVPDENFAAIMASGGFDKAIEWLPIGNISAVIVGLLDQRQRNMALLWEQVGLSDILRGTTNPRESGKSQQLKMQRAGGERSRMGTKKKKLERLARDAIRLMAELAAELCSPETLLAITGIDPGKLQQTGMQEIMTILRSNKLRDFKIDVETDSTVAPDEMREQQELVEFMGALSQLIAAAQGAAATGAMNPQALQEIILYTARKFRAGSDLEDVIRKGVQMKPQGDGADKEKQADMMLKQMKLEMDKQEMLADNMLKAEELKLKWAELEQKGKVEEAKIQQKRIESLINRQTAMINAQGGNVRNDN